VLDGDPAPSPLKGHSPTIFGPYLLWPNGWMDQDASWYRVRPQPKRHCVRWGPSCPSPKRGQSPQFSAHVCCSQMAGWIKMPLGTEVDLSPGHIVLDGTQLPCERGTAACPLLLVHVYCGGSRPPQLLLGSCLAFYIRGAHWRHLADMTETFMCGGDVALCQISLTTCCTDATECPHTSQWAALYPLKIWGMWTPSNTWFLGSTRVLSPYGVSIG